MIFKKETEFWKMIEGDRRVKILTSILNKIEASSPYIIRCALCCCLGFPGGSNGKESACKAGGLDSSPGLGRSPEEGNGNPLQYLCLGNPMDRGAWQATVHGVAKSQAQLSDQHLLFCCCLVTKLGPILCDPMDCSLPVSSVHGISQARIHWDGLPFPSPGDLPYPGIKLPSPALAGGIFTTEPPRKTMCPIDI